MPKIEIKFSPELTKETLMESFRDHFDGKYEVNLTKVVDRDFVVKKSKMAGVFVKLKQKKEKTEVVFNKNAPSALFRALFGIIAMLFAGNDVLRDVKEFLETSPKFK